MASSSSASASASVASASVASSSAAPGVFSLGERDESSAEERSITGLLSDDTLLHILRRISTRELLSSLAFVCHRWRRLCRSFLVYELLPCPLSPSKKPWGNMRRKRLLDLAATNAPTLERVHLHGLKQLNSKDIIALCENLPKLQDLAIISCPNIGTAELESIASRLPKQLVSLDLHRDHAIASLCQINDKILADLHQRCPQLQKLDLDVNSEITQNGLNGLLKSCRSLTSLDLHSNLIGWSEVAQVFASCKSLRHFSLVSRLLNSPSGSPDSYENLNGFAEIYRRGRPQKNWGRDGSYVSSAAASLAVDMPKCMKSIRLYSSQHRSVPLDVSPIRGMLQSNGQQLQQLHAQGLFNTSWQTVSVWCTNLKLLDLTHYRDRSVILTGVEEIVLCGLIRMLRKLECIALPSATDHILSELGRFCPNLKEIRFQENGPRDTMVTDRGIVAVAEGCPGLRVLSVSECHNLTISSARALAFHCRQLRVLMLNGCDKFTDDAVAALLPRLSSSLVFLDLVGCKISQAALEAIRSYASVTSLRVVAIAKPLWHRSQSVISEIHSSNPRLKVRVDSGIVWDGFYHGITFD